MDLSGEELMVKSREAIKATERRMAAERSLFIEDMIAFLDFCDKFWLRFGR